MFSRGRNDRDLTKTLRVHRTGACFINFAQHNERNVVSFLVASQSTEVCAGIGTRYGLDGPWIESQ